MKFKLSYIPVVSHLVKQNLIYLLCFFIPLSKGICSYIIAAMLLFWLLEGKFKERFKLLFSEKKRILLMSFSVIYLLYIIGLINTSNFAYAGFDLQVKLSIIVFPLIFSTIDFKHYNNQIILSLLKTFIYGVLLNTIICLIYAIYQYFYNDHDAGHFLYAKLSGTLYLHPTYLAMYLSFAIMAILSILFNDVYNIKKRLRNRLIIYTVFFSFFIILLNSKAGIISLALCYIIFIVYLIIKLKRIKLGLILLLTVVISCVGVSTIIPSALNRLKVAFVVVSQNKGEIKETGESTSDRILIWRTSTEIIKNNFFIGVGTGDVKDVLLAKYKEKKLWYSYDHKLNAHNQFLQTFISIGVLGFLALLASIIIPLIYAIKRNNMIHVFFLIIFFVNIMFESMLETQAGVVFYAFFNSFLLMVSYKKTIND